MAGRRSLFGVLLLFPTLAESVADVDTEEAADGTPEYRSHRKGIITPEDGEVAAKGAAEKEKEENEFFGHRFR